MEEIIEESKASQTHDNERHGLWLSLLAITDSNCEVDFQGTIDSGVDMDTLWELMRSARIKKGRPVVLEAWRRLG